MYVNRFDQRKLAWSMVDIVAPHLAPDDRSWLCVKIGAGDLESAMITLVGTCMRNAIVLPANVKAALCDWLRGYSGTEVAAAFEPYIGPTRTDVALTDVDSISDRLRVGCERFGNRPRRVSQDRLNPGCSRPLNRSG